MNDAVAIVVLGVLGLVELVVRGVVMVALFFVLIMIVSDADGLERLIAPYCWDMLSDYLGVAE